MSLTKIRKRLKRVIALAESKDPLRIAQNKRYIVQSRNDLPEGLMGVFIRVGVRGGVIYYRSSLKGHTLRYILSHELAHGILGHTGTSLTTQADYNGFNWYSSLRQEKEAHLCAACLLLDDHDFTHESSLPNLAKETGVPYNIIEKWHNLNISETTPKNQKW